jgi:hypothetical protein
MDGQLLQQPNQSDKQATGADNPTNVGKHNQQPESSPNTIQMSTVSSEGQAQKTESRSTQTPELLHGDSPLNGNPLEVGPIPVSDGPPNPSLPIKQPYIRACAICPKCEKDMVPKGKQDPTTELWPHWECAEHGSFKENELGYRIRYSIGKEIVTPRGKVRDSYQMTTEAQKNQRDWLLRVKELKELAKDQADHIPSQKTHMSAQQCRLGESLFRVLHQNKQNDEVALKTVTRFYEKFNAETLEIALGICSAAQGKTSPIELREFVREFASSKLNGTPAGLIRHAKTTHWKGDKCKQPSLIEALRKAIEFVSSRVTPERRDHLLTAAYYIAGRFQPDPSVFVPPSVLMDHDVKKWCLYDYAEERTEWEHECNKIEQANKTAKERGQPIQPLPEEPVEIIDYRYKPHPTKPGAFYVVKCERPRPWTYSEAKTMIAEVRYLKKIMTSPTLNGEPAGWCEPPGQDLLMPTGGVWGERKKEQLRYRMLINRTLTTEEKQSILDYSITIDNGQGAASVLWQGWGGGRKDDIKKYCQENYVWQDGQIRVNRDQTKNASFKAVTSVQNFYYMAFFLMKTNRWSTKCFQKGYMDLTRKRILTKAGFWEESWADNLSIADQMPGSSFEYAPFDPNLDFPDIGRFVEFLRKPSPIRDLIIAGMPSDDADRILHGSSRAPGLSEIIAGRLNVLRDGPLLYDQSRFPDPNHPPRNRAISLMKTPDISPPNLKCLNRWFFEDALPGLLNTRQNYPRNALRRSGITAHCLLFDDPSRTAQYFSSGKRSVEIAYQCPENKQYSREHWTMGYTAISKSLGTDRAHLLPPDHKLDEFRTPEVIAIESKISEDAAAFQDSEKDTPKRRPGYCAQNPKYTPEERKALIAEYQQRISCEEKLTLAAYAKEKEMGVTTLTTMLQASGVRQHRTEEEVKVLVEEFRQEAQKGVSIKEFSTKKGIPYDTLYKYLNDAKLCTKRRSLEEISALLKQLEASDMTDAEFAEKIGVCGDTLRKWKADAARNVTSEQDGSTEDVQNCKAQMLIADYQTCKKENPGLTPKKFAALRGRAYSTVRALFAKVGGLLAPVKRHSRDEIKNIIKDFDQAREENPALCREDYASKHGITSGTLNIWLSDGFRSLMFSGNGDGTINGSGDGRQQMD